MRVIGLATRSALAALAGALCLGATPAWAQKTLDFYAQPALTDLSTSVSIVSKNDRELEKIGKGYVDAYRLDKQQIWCKEPGRMRFEGKQGVFTIRYVTNGNQKLTEVPTLRIHKVDDISKEPAKGDTISDLGLVSTAWAKRVESRWLRAEDRGGKNLQVFEFWYNEDPRARHTLWLDPSTKTIVEHVAHHRNRNKPGFRKRLVYSEVKQIEGVWVPARVAMYNGENKLAGEMRYNSIKVNENLQDKMFAIK